MQKIRKLFGSFRMSWPKVIIFAVITAVYTALINQVPFLHDTSFQDIAVNLECWFLFAVFIIVNCEKWWEASLKTFVFFLISQPLVYLIEVPFIGWSVFQYYKYWAVITVLTLPGAAIAFLLKKKNLLSVFVLSVATGYLGYACASYSRSAISDFPHHLLSAVFCFLLAVFFIIVLLDEKKHRILAAAIFAAAIVCSVIFLNLSNPGSAVINLGEGDWSYSIEDDSFFDVEIEDGTAVVKAKKDGGTYLYFTKNDGTEEEYYITVSGGGVTINQF